MTESFCFFKQSRQRHSNLPGIHTEMFYFRITFCM
jgi:hypothetical protein